MPPMSERVIPPEDTFNLLRERAKTEDDFVVKILRRQSLGHVPEMIAMLSGARVEHFSTPELWVPDLSGGGNYSMQAYSPADMSKPIGGFIQFKVSSVEPRDVDASMVKKSNWRGPVTLDFPSPGAPREVASPMYDVKPPSAPGSGDSATRSTQAWARQAGGGYSRHEESESYSQNERMRSGLEAERRKFEEERLVNERDRHRNEMDSVKKSFESQLSAVRAEFMSIQNRPQDNSMAELLKVQAEDRRAAATLAAEERRDREKRESEERRDAISRQERADERFNKMFEKLTERPKEDPLAMIEKVASLIGKNNSNEATMKMMGSMAEMHSMQIGTAMDFIQHTADLNLGGGGEKESPVVKAIEAGVRGLGAMVKGAGMKRTAPPFIQQPQLPPTYEQQARAQQAQQQTQQPQQVQQVQQQVQQQPQQVQQQQPQQQPQPQPQLQRHPQQHPQQQPQQPQPQQVEQTAIQQIEMAIRARYPIAQVADALVAHFGDPSIQAAIADAQGDIQALLDKRLGNWMNESPENKTYAAALHVELEKRLEAAGFFEEEEEENGEKSNEDPENEGE